MKIGVYVGSFNPIHKGHIHVVNYLLKNKYVDKVLLIATPNYWDKQDLIDVDKRIDMLRYYENKNIIVDTKHHDYKYTYQVLDSLKKDYTNDDLYLIIGSDNVLKFHLWDHVEELLNYKILVLQRDKTNVEEYIKRFNTNNFIIVKGFKPINISSTEIRNNLSKDYLDDKVYEYIRNNHLYEV